MSRGLGRHTRRHELARLLVIETDDCITWPFGLSSAGYARVTVGRRKIYAHRIACELRHGPAPPNKPHAAHSCNNRACVNPRHLRWATHAENQADRYQHGTHNLGERNPSAKLNRDQVRAIRRAVNQDQRPSSLATEYGVSVQTIRKIIRGEKWGWLS